MSFFRILNVFLWVALVMGLEQLGAKQIELGVRARDDISQSFLLNPRYQHMNSLEQRTDQGPIREEDAASPPWIHELKNRYISIFKTALGKEFLLRFNTLWVGPVPAFRNGASRVVVFKKMDEKLFLLEAPDGYIIDEDLSLSLVLVEFPIIEEKDEVITFDFNAGMSQHFFYSSSWHGSDYPAQGLQGHFTATDLQFSYVDEAVLLESNQVFIRQVAQMKLNLSRVPLEIRYFLSPYKENPHFKVVRGGEFDKMAFFEVAPRYNKYGRQDIYATKFDLTKPIVFALSPNTPSEYRQAVQDGVLYWNQAFPRDVVSVVDVPEGISPPASRLQYYSVGGLGRCEYGLCGCSA